MLTVAALPICTELRDAAAVLREIAVELQGKAISQTQKSLGGERKGKSQNRDQEGFVWWAC